MRTTVKKVEGRSEVMVERGWRVKFGTLGGTGCECIVARAGESCKHHLIVLASGNTWSGSSSGADHLSIPLSEIIAYGPKNIRIFDTTGSQVGPTYPDVAALKAQPASEEVDKDIRLSQGNIVAVRSSTYVFSSRTDAGGEGYGLVCINDYGCLCTSKAKDSTRLYDHIGWMGESDYRSAIIYDNLAEYLKAKIDEATKAGDWRSQFRVERWKSGWAVLNEKHWLEYATCWLTPQPDFRSAYTTESEAREALRKAYPPPGMATGPAALRSAA